MSKDDGESSKQAVKGAKKERRAIAAALRDELEYLEDIEFSESDTDSNSESDSDATTALSPHMKKKTRGPAKIDFVAPIDGKRIEQQFNVDGSHRRYIMSAMGRSWRNYKSVLTRKIIALVKSNDATRNLEALKGLKPRNIKSVQQWQRFIKERVSAEFKMQERQNSQITRVDVWIRAHTKKDGTAINEDVAEKLRTQVSEDASTIHGDALTHVLGKERNGRVRGAGSRVTATLMNLEALSKSHTA
ncbi:hypothetical protein WN944_022218 [Citrus x changshan-huyou]|uniref:Uncharacterized protein n=1 Tax=Citrus x changshan-huyou TaxID=2935761 RepID=A0AAP0R078_9ROSI